MEEPEERSEKLRPNRLTRVGDGQPTNFSMNQLVLAVDSAVWSLVVDSWCGFDLKTNRFNWQFWWCVVIDMCWGRGLPSSGKLIAKDDAVIKNEFERYIDE